jgi:hypothetical protein
MIMPPHCASIIQFPANVLSAAGGTLSNDGTSVEISSKCPLRDRKTSVVGSPMN